MNDLITQQVLSPSEMAVKLVKLTKLKKEVDAQIAVFREQLLEETKRNDVLTLKTGSYTISRCKRVTPTLESLEDLRGWFEHKGLEFATKEVPEDWVMATVRDSVKKGNVPEGISAQETEYVVVKVNKKD